MFKIAEILDVSVSDLLESESTVINQAKHYKEIGYQYQQTIEKLFQENKEVYEKLIASKDEQIIFLKNLIEK